MIRLSVVEDHPAIAEGLGALLATEPGIEMVGVAKDVAGADEMITTRRPDVVLCDVMLEGRDAGFELLARHGGRSRFILYSAYDYQAHHARAVRSGAAGFISKTADIETIVESIRRVADGRKAFSGAVLESAREAPRMPTRRELELIRLMAAGAPNDDIGAAMAIRVKTVEGMLRRLFDRYNVANRTQLAHYATNQGWLTSAVPGAARTGGAEGTSSRA